MIDMHTHILPCMDDGSHSVEESIQMLKISAEQGVQAVALTPHFYADQEGVHHFLKRREISLQSLLGEIKKQKNLPQLMLGAEVHYFEGISQADDLKKLCIGKYLLVEMPFSEWSGRAISEMQNLENLRGIVPVLAHIERYFGIAHNFEDITYLASRGCLLQMNASAFGGYIRGRKARAMLKNGEVHLLGSDCHNLTTRPPNLGQIFSALEKKVDSRIIDAIKHNSCEIFGEYKTVS